MALEEVTVVASSSALRRIAAFLHHAAEQMERHGDLFEHEHLEDFEPAFRQGPSLVVVREPRVEG